jgi:membrane protein implicated in regulation of membrane protease activity
MMLLIWIVVALVFAVAEVGTSAFFAAFLAAGAVAAAAVAFAGQGTLTQALAFAAVSLLGIVVARPWLRRRFNGPRGVETLSGAISMIGEVATVVETVAGRQRPDVRGNGHVRILGEDWPAASSDDSVLSPGTLVQIIDIEGSTLVVERTARIGGVAAPPAFS